jgi:hypothetical protein
MIASFTRPTDERVLQERKQRLRGDRRAESSGNLAQQTAGRREVKRRAGAVVG